MNEKTTFDDQLLIEEILRRRQSKEPGIPAEKVKLLMAHIGQEIERTGHVTKEQVEHLLEQLKNGEL